MLTQDLHVIGHACGTAANQQQLANSHLSLSEKGLPLQVERNVVGFAAGSLGTLVSRLHGFKAPCHISSFTADTSDWWA
jgi:hypothetical protein